MIAIVILSDSRMLEAAEGCKSYNPLGQSTTHREQECTQRDITSTPETIFTGDVA